jgi:hypothetical protein
MILINLLPPELRRRHGGVSPVLMSVVGGGSVCLLLLLFWLYILYVRIPNADRVIAEKNQELTEKTAKANEVLELEKKITEAEDRRKQIVDLMLRKMYWARNLDEFTTLLNGPFTVPGFDVRCQDITISESSVLPGNASRRSGGAAAGAEVAFSVNWRFKLLGKERQLSGDYIKSFFDTIKGSKFWDEQGFSGKPEESYLGDVPRLNTGIGRVVIEGDLKWQRLKIVEEKARR